MHFSKIITFLAFLFIGQFAYSQSHVDGGEPGLAPNSEVEAKEKKFNIGEMITHHISDAHEWHFATSGHTHYSIPLPCIVWNKGGLNVFSSNRFKNEHHEEVPYEGLKLEEGKIVAEDGSFVLDLSITKNVASLLISFVLLLSIFFTVAKSYKERVGKAPKGVFRFKRPDELAAETIEFMMLQLPDFDKTRIDDVMVGNAMPEAEQGLNVARIAVASTMLLISLFMAPVRCGPWALCAALISAHSPSRTASFFRSAVFSRSSARSSARASPPADPHNRG